MTREQPLAAFIVFVHDDLAYITRSSPAAERE